MASFISVVQRLTKKTLTMPRRLNSSSSSVSQHVFEDITTEDHPIELEKNPFEKEKQQCILCKLNIIPDYKNVRLLSQFQSSYTGRIYGRHITGLCSHKQKKVENEIFKAQNAGLMGYYTKDPKFLNDPKIFDPDHPFRPHNFE